MEKFLAKDLKDWVSKGLEWRKKKEKKTPSIKLQDFFKVYFEKDYLKA